MNTTLTIPRVDKHKLLAEKCRRSFYFFVQHFWDTIIAEEPVWNWHIKYLCEELQEVGKRVADRLPKEYDYYIINLPPGSSKSTIVSEMYPLWCWTIDPTQKFICASYSSTVAEDIAQKCFNIYHSEKFIRLFPHLNTKKSSGGKTHFHNGLKGERYTTSSGSMIQGVHVHQKVLDDVIGRDQAHSIVERKKVNDWMSETISTRNVDANISVTILVMQRLHQQDPTGYLLKKEGLKIKHICIPAELSADVLPKELSNFYVNGLFDPVRKSFERLIVEKAELGSYGYAGQMQQRPSPVEGGIIKKTWFNIINTPLPMPVEATINFQLDTAYTENLKNDPTAILSYYVHNNNLYITHATSVWKEFPDIIRFLPEYVKARGYRSNSMIHVEPKASGISIVQTIKDATELNIIESKPPIDDKLSRLYRVSPKIESGRVYLHEGSWNESFINQVTDFPNAEHDDEVDCLTATIIRELMNPDDFNYESLNAFI